MSLTWKATRDKGELVTVQQFEGASAIVSGGAGGLGEATVRRLHADGLGVVIADLAADKGKALADELGGRALFVSTDVTSEDSVLGAIEQANQLGQLRYAVVAHGGFGVAQRIVQRDGSPADFGGFTKTIDLYLNGTYNMARLVAASVATAEPRDGERGALVLTASIAGYEGQIGQTAYAAAKAGVIGLTIAAARDLSSVGIRVNTIAPGTMKTPIMESVGEEAIAKFAANVPFPKRLGSPDEFADAATFLLTNGYVNGEVMRLDGARRGTPKEARQRLQPAVHTQLRVHPLRRVLLLECAEAFARLGAKHAGLHPDPVEQAQIVVQTGLDHAPRSGRGPAALRKKVFGHIQQVVMRNHSRHHAPVEGLLGGECPAGEHQVL